MELMKKLVKPTFYGPIPDDWIVCLFEDVIDGFSSGMTPYRGTPEFYKGYIPWITSGELNYNIITDTHEKITRDAIIKTNLKVLPVGTFLMAITGLEAAGTRGSCGITGIKATTNQSCMALFPKEGKIDSKYLYHFYVQYGDELAFKFCQGTKQQSYTGRIVKILPINLPPTLTEQKAIATALSDVDALIFSLEQTITKKKAIKQGAMQILFKEHDTWESKRVSEFGFDISDGNYSAKYPKSSEFKESGVCFIRAKNIKNMTVNEDDMRFISQELHSELKKGHLKKDDILITNRGDIGQTALVPDKFEGSNINAQIVRINTNNKLNKLYLFYFLRLNSTQNKIQNMQTGSALKQLPVNRLNQIEIYYPSTKTQTLIGETLLDIDKEILSIETKKEKYQAIKQGMMQELLTGKTRLV